ncbi:hypothetical protein AB0D12_39125 [Streptomyces sp. NPDC048479]|uniref:hypothetical protein n=1 Tax=Streptomyces sp. NPDC048479 TaxID=3154725 RepID=UPI00342C9CE0
MAELLVGDIFDALVEQTVAVPGTSTLGVVEPWLARSLAAPPTNNDALWRSRTLFPRS